MPAFSIRSAQSSDLARLARLRADLWPATSAEEHAGELTLILAGKFPGILPLVVFVAEASDGTLFGFLEASLRSCADECDLARPVGYIEGWYVVESARQEGIGAALVSAAEDWARSLGCKEMASDAALDNLVSQHAHEGSASGSPLAPSCTASLSKSSHAGVQR